jgi:hypothetical protein
MMIVRTVANPLLKNNHIPMFKFNLGADPEFLLFHNNRLAPAYETLQTSFGKKDFARGSDGFIIKKSDSKTAGVLGWDGHNRTGEMRPSPSKNPQDIVENIGKMVEKATETVPYLTMTTLSLGNPIGGHIHLEIPQNTEENNLSPEYKKNIEVIEARGDPAIGRMMALYLAPIIASEHRISAALRMASNGYGKIHDIRKNNVNPGARTVEVRGLTAEWTCRPDIALATLTYLGVVWHEILTRGPNSIMRSPISLKTIQQTDSLQTMLLSEYQPVMDSVIKAVYQQVKKFELYKDHKDAVDLIFDYKKTSKMKEEVGWNLTQGWTKNEAKPKNTTKRTFLSDARIKRELKKIDEESLQTMSQENVTYNDDFNMTNLMSALNTRITALSIELQHDYFFYGLKKNTENFLIVSHEKRDEDKNQVLTHPNNLTRDEITSISTKMYNRYLSGKKDTRGQLKINPKTGKNIDQNQTIITFGIPYELRVNGDIKLFLAKVWDVERNLLVPIAPEAIPATIAHRKTEVNEKELPDDIRNLLEDPRTLSYPDSIINPNTRI